MTPPEFASKTNDYLTSYIVFADTKGGAILTFTSALGAVIGFVAPTLLVAARTAGCIYFTLGWFFAAAAALGVAMTLWFCLEAITPRTPKAAAQRTSNKLASLHSFPDIAGMSLADFQGQVGNLDPPGAATQLSIHNFTLARIADDKYQSLKSATLWLRLALLGTVANAVLFAVASIVGGTK